MTVFTAQVYAANPVSYSLNPASRSYQPGSVLQLQLSLTTSQAIAGVSVDIGLSNAVFSSFNTANSPAFILVDYHADQRDVVAICQNNNCPPGTYTIGTLNLTAGQLGAMHVVLTPVETADSSLKPIGADGARSSYSITQSAPPSTIKTPPKNTYTIPRANSGPTLTPTVVNEDELADQEEMIPVGPSQNAPNNATQPHSGAEKQATATSRFSPPIIIIAFGLFWLVSIVTVVKVMRRRQQGGYIPGSMIQPAERGPDDSLPPRPPYV